MRTKKELLDTIADDTHALWGKPFVDEVNAAFGVSLKCHDYSDQFARDVGPKGLTLNVGVSTAVGLSSFSLAPMLCNALGVKYEIFMGRGFQVRECIAKLREAGHASEG